MSRLLIVCNQKGGVGKTTTAINLSAYLARAGKRTLLIDSDPQGNATSGIGIDRSTLSASLYDALVGEQEISQLILKTEVTNLDILPSSPDLTGADVELVNHVGREFLLKRALELAREQYEFLLIDSPPSLGLLTVNGLTAADRVLIPMQCEYYALEGLSQLLKTIELVRERLNPGLEIEGVLLTMADFRTNLTNEVIQEARNFFKEKVFRTIIPRNIRLSEAPSFGKPIALYDNASLGAKRYQELADELLARTTPPPNAVAGAQARAGEREETH